MHKPEKTRPPRIPLALLHLFSDREQLEDIEGDLLERYYSSLEIDGINKAKWLFTKDVFQILFSGWMIDQLCQKILKMKRINWIKLLAVNILLIFLIVSPFLPGPPNRFVNGLSILGQATGLAGLLLVPVALIWIVYEIRKAKLANTKINWKVPYFLAITFLVIVFLIFGLFAIAIYYIEGWITGTLVSLVIIAVMWLVLRGVLRLRRKDDKRFNPTPIYLSTLPVIAFLANLFIVTPISEYSRNASIRQAQGLINMIEDYKFREGDYPESIDVLREKYNTRIPNPKVMGVLNYRYNKINEDYSLSFSQWLEWGSLEVIVLYDKNNLRNRLKGRYAEWDYSFDLCRTNGAFASYDTKFENWRYYLCD